jgi:transmembrane sensor
MATKVTRLGTFGSRVARAQDAALLGLSDLVTSARTRWLEGDDRPATIPRSSQWRLWRGVAAALTVVLAIVCFAVRPMFGAALAFEIGPIEATSRLMKAQPGKVGEWIPAPAHAPLPVRFSDGSVIHLRPAARVRVEELARHGARVLLERGSAQANVVHRAGASWTFRAGPFEIRVVGTAFEAAWDPARELFTVTLQQGIVAVSGCSLPGERMVVSGETFRAMCRDGLLVWPDPQTSPSPAPPTAVAEIADLPDTSPGPSATNMDGALPAHVARGRRWQDLVASGRYADALAAAEGEGIPSICASAEVTELMRLSDAARFTGHSNRADFILRRIRQRFPDDERASVAAFHLGRIAFDERRAYAEAAGWFDTYLAERPSGALGREASGRLMESLERSGDDTRARETAKRYLEVFPSGPHANVARSIAER